MTRRATATLVLACAAALAWGAHGGRWPWQRRIGRDVEEHHRLAHRNVEPSMWPPEPKSPDPVDPDRFRDAFGELCGRMPPDRLERYAAAILAESARFGIDPFLLAALAHDRSGCRPKTPEDSTLYGLTRIDVGMHAPHIRGGRYKYFVLEEGEWKERHLDVGLYPFNKWKAAKWSTNLYWAAAILRVLEDQCPSLDRAFPERTHRHFVSHWFYGDNVREIEPEDRVLTGRRRLLAYYHDTVPEAAGTFLGVPLVSPLDGVPRLVIDYFGNPRGKRGGPGHQGVDIVGLQGEPLRAVAAGTVVFAGVDLGGSGRSERLTPERAAEYPGDRMGPGGLYVAINHAGAFRSYYMHMGSLAVADREEVEAGRIIGTVGRTGSRISGAHLHLEFRVGTDRVDPAVPLADVLVNPFADSD